MRYRLEKFGIHILAFMVARSQLLGMYPFVVPFFMAAYIQEYSGASLYVAVLVGVLSRFSYVEAFKYALVLGTVVVTLHQTDRTKIFTNNIQIALLSGVILWAVSMPYEYIVTGKDISVVYALLEGVIATCATLIFEQGLIALRVGTSRRFATNERFVGVFSFVVLVMIGCPKIDTPIHFLFLIAAYLILYNGYRFESSVGMTTGAMVGMVLAYKLADIRFLAIMIILAAIIVLLKELGKVSILVGFFGGYLLLAYLYDKQLLDSNMLITSLVVCSAFIATPGQMLKRSNVNAGAKTLYAQDVLLQEITKERVKEFGQAFIDMEQMLTLHEQECEAPSYEGLSNVYLSGDGISLLNFVESQNNRLMEMRKNFINQLGRIGESIANFSMELTTKSVRSEQFESKIVEELSREGVMVTKAILTQNKNEQLEAYVACLLEKDAYVTGRMIAEKIGNILRRDMACVKREDEIVGRSESAFSFVEKGKYLLTTGIVRKNKLGETVCGDNFSVVKIDDRKAVMMLSDGMGYGNSASVKSEQVVDLLEELLRAGFCRELAIWLLNSFISFISDGNDSSSLDLAMIDLYDGTADFIKLGASTTFIKRKNMVECIRSTSLPVGVLEQVEFDTCARRLYHGDMLIMISDGVMDSVIFENKETYLSDLIASIETNNVQRMAEAIMKDIDHMNDGKLRDDSTVLVSALWER